MQRLLILGDLLFCLGLYVYCLWHYQPDWQYFLGMTLATTGMVLWMTARVQLGSSFSPRPEARELVTTGLYSKIRNPIYVFGGLGIVGLCLAMRWYIPGAILVALNIIVQWRRARAEARALEAKFGDTYRQYRARTWF